MPCYIQNVIYIRVVQLSANISPTGVKDAVLHTERHIHQSGTAQRKHKSYWSKGYRVTYRTSYTSEWYSSAQT